MNNDFNTPDPLLGDLTGSSDLLQEKSDIISSIQSKIKTVVGASLTQLNLSTEKPSVIAEEKIKQHINKLEEELGAMRERGDYGTPLPLPDGSEREKDIVFIRTPAKLTDEQRAELNKE